MQSTQLRLLQKYFLMKLYVFGRMEVISNGGYIKDGGKYLEFS
jgi:hypothetical protein